MRMRTKVKMMRTRKRVRMRTVLLGTAAATHPVPFQPCLSPPAAQGREDSSPWGCPGMGTSSSPALRSPSPLLHMAMGRGRGRGGGLPSLQARKQKQPNKLFSCLDHRGAETKPLSSPPTPPRPAASTTAMTMTAAGVAGVPSPFFRTHPSPHVPVPPTASYIPPPSPRSPRSPPSLSSDI